MDPYVYPVQELRRERDLDRDRSLDIVRISLGEVGCGQGSGPGWEAVADIEDPQASKTVLFEYQPGEEESGEHVHLDAGWRRQGLLDPPGYYSGTATITITCAQ